MMFNLIVDIIETILFLIIIANIFKKNKKFSPAGLGFISFVILSVIYRLLSIFDIYNQIKVYVLITSLIFIKVYFYETSKYRNLTNTIGEINNIYKAQKNIKTSTYFFIAILFMLESVSVSIHSNLDNRYCFNFIPTVCAILSFIYQFHYIIITKKYILKPFLFFTLSLILFFSYNIYLNLFVLFPNIVNLFFVVLIRTLQTFTIGYITFNRKHFFKGLFI